jgi:transcriptional enhancer factor
MIMANQNPMRPVIFWLLITSSEVGGDAHGGYTGEHDLYRDGVVAHRYTGLTSQRRRESLETISNWRLRYPYLEQLQANGDLNCEIIHMGVFLNLMNDHAREGSELVTRTELIIPCREGDQGHWHWQTVTSVTKPTELYRDTITDPPLEAKTFLVEVLSASDTEIRIKLPFPATTWAHAFTCLTDLQMKYEENRNVGSFLEDLNGSARSARDYVEQISMYQEIQSSSGPHTPFVRRAIILWTFQKARSGEEGDTSWQYLDPSPPRRTCMSPSPNPSHHMCATISENFNSWADPLHLQHPNMLDPFVQGLATPPNTSGLQSPFITSGYPYLNQQFDIHSKNLSFASSATMDSESTLVGDDVHANIDSFLSNANVNLSDYDHNSQAWQLPHIENFDSDPAWANYTVPSSTTHIEWDSDAKNHPWPEGPDSKGTPWIEENATKHEWAESASSPLKEDKNFVKQNVEQKLLPWINHVEEEASAYVEASEVNHPDSNARTSDTKQEWISGDADFDYNQLAEGLK